MAEIHFQSHSCTVTSNPAKAKTFSIGRSHEIQNEDFFHAEWYCCEGVTEHKVAGERQKESGVNLSIHIIISSWSHMEQNALLTQKKGMPKTIGASFNLLPYIRKHQLTSFAHHGSFPKEYVTTELCQALTSKSCLFLSFGMTPLIRMHPQSVINAEWIRGQRGHLQRRTKTITYLSNDAAFTKAGNHLTEQRAPFASFKVSF